MKIKTNELTGAALYWAVAKCEGIYFEDFEHSAPDYSDWAQAGPLIEKYGITIADHSPASRYKINGWVAWRGRHELEMSWNNQPTPLIAAMQCIVATELGMEIDIPEGMSDD